MFVCPSLVIEVEYKYTISSLYKYDTYFGVSTWELKKRNFENKHNFQLKYEILCSNSELQIYEPLSDILLRVVFQGLLAIETADKIL